MKNYMLFVIFNHNPEGGMKDFENSFDYISDAQEHYNKRYLDDCFYEGHIFSIKDNMIVSRLLENSEGKLVWKMDL
jgi:hypothetical protein